MPTILCLQDDPAIRQLLVDALQRAGHRILLAASLKEAAAVQSRGDANAATVVVAVANTNVERLRRLTDESPAADNAVVLTSLNVVEAEARLIERALEVARGNRTRAAALLGISVRTLRNKLNGRKVEAVVE